MIIFILSIVICYLLKSLKDQKQNVLFLNHQIEFQTEKYRQISSAYRKTRSIIHDARKHVIYINGCINQNKEEEILPYLKKVSEDLEHGYSLFNTGNLVIDSFINNYYLASKERQIAFHTNIRVSDEEIPLNNYDFSIILGNLLDNSFEECSKITDTNDLKEKEINVEILTENKNMLIHVINSVFPQTSQKKQNDFLFHGYGIENINRILKKYDGIYTVNESDKAYETIILIPYS